MSPLDGSKGPCNFLFSRHLHYDLSIFIFYYLLIFSSLRDFNIRMTLSSFRCGSGRASTPASLKAPDGRKWRRPRRYLSYRLAQVTCCGLCCGTETC